MENNRFQPLQTSTELANALRLLRIAPAFMLFTDLWRIWHTFRSSMEYMSLKRRFNACNQ